MAFIATWLDNEPEYTDIVADFTKLIDRLKKLATRKEFDELDAVTERDAAQVRANDAMAERDKAVKAIAQLEAIFGE